MMLVAGQPRGGGGDCRSYVDIAAALANNPSTIPIQCRTITLQHVCGNGKQISKLRAMICYG